MPRIDPPRLNLSPSGSSGALGDLGGLTQFGVRIERLPPGSALSPRDRHASEDVFVHVLEGRLVLVADTGEAAMGPGSSAAFPAGRCGNPALENRARTDATVLLAASRTGAPIDPAADAGPLQPPPGAGGGSGLVRLNEAIRRSGSGYPEPYASLMSKRSWIALGEAGGLTRFGVNLVTLAPGGLSSLRHWHSAEDEFVLVLDGALVLADDSGDARLEAGDATAHSAGIADGHHMRNESAAPVRFLVIGTRAARDVCTYPDVDLINVTEGDRSWYTTRDGTLLKGHPG
jgi:uncharacterized cupin superfamily protein